MQNKQVTIWALISTGLFVGAIATMTIDKDKHFLTENGFIVTGSIAALGLVGVTITLSILAGQAPS